MNKVGRNTVIKSPEDSSGYREFGEFMACVFAVLLFAWFVYASYWVVWSWTKMNSCEETRNVAACHMVAVPVERQ